MSIQTGSVTQVGVGSSSSITVAASNTSALAYSTIVTGSATYSIQHSLVASVFIDNNDITSSTVSAFGNYVFPLESLRINIESGAGTVVLKTRQLVN